MAKILIAFLGKAQEGRNYRLATYRFATGTVSEKTSMFSLALAQQEKPDRVVLLGTAGSMWDVFFLDAKSIPEAHTGVLEHLMEAVQTPEGVTVAHLEALRPLAELVFGCACVPRRIPYGRTEAEQVAILQTMAEEVAPGDEVILDLTHGFRHLPMLGLMSAFYLQSIQGAKIRGISYGALDMTENGLTPVIDLAGLLTMGRWMSALNSYEKDGDYGVFARLLPDKMGQPLAQAAFHERTSNSVLAKDRLQDFENLTKTEDLSALPPTAQLFMGELRKRISWWKGKDRAHRERSLAEIYRKRGDFLRASVFGYEACLTQKVMQDKLGNPIEFQIRKEADGALSETVPDFNHLKNLRNSLAHGLPAKNPRIDQNLKDSVTMDHDLKRLFAKLFSLD